MQIHYSDVLVIGGGLAGLRTAIGVKRRGLDTVILSLVPAKQSHSVAAQGGMQASLGNTVKGAGDNEDVHFTDTVRGSDWGCDQTVARMFAHMAPKAVRELAAWGVPWSRVRAGDREAVIQGERVTLTESAAAHGLITARDFGGTRNWRTCYTSDGTGHTMMYTLSDQAIAAQIPVHERQEAVALIHDDGRCFGAVVRDLVSGELSAWLARATVMATGGYGRIYGISTNATISEGMGHALALETGQARLANLEAVQFHPTAIVPSGILVTEGCRGDGGVLRDIDGYAFMGDYEPEKKDLASRDVVSRRMVEHMRAGKSIHSGASEHLWLDITALGAAHIDRNLREVRDICQYFLGIDPVRDYIPVRPTQHYSMGGIRTDYRGESPTLRGLFACGEVACWDLHGFNRLGGNSVAETVVAGMLAGEYIADFCNSAEGHINLSTTLAQDCLNQQTHYLDGLLAGAGNEDPVAIRRDMEHILTEQVGIFRSGPELEQACAELAALYQRSLTLRVDCRARGANPELVLAYRLPRMLMIALAVARGALARTESRGAHYRVDYPERNDRDWLNRTLYQWDTEHHHLNLEYEPLAISDMELTPALRGYGAKQIIEHPDAKRLARQPPAPEDFRNLLPERYRGDNERMVLT